jgi:hypothetical protein
MITTVPQTSKMPLPKPLLEAETDLQPLLDTDKEP